MELDLGIAGLTPTPELARAPARWAEVESRMRHRPVLHADGLSVQIGPPQIVEGGLEVALREVAGLFDRFYRAVIARYRPGAREFLPNPRFEPAIEAEPPGPMPLPLARLDCVLTPGGELRVIEINPIGICTGHLRTATFLAGRLARHQLEEDSRIVSTLDRSLLDAFDRFSRADGGPGRPAVGLLHLPNMYRVNRVVLRKVFRQAGWTLVEGAAGEVDMSGDRLCLRGQPIDLLWGDYLFYFGYQLERYRDARWHSKIADYSNAERESLAILGDPRALALMRARRFRNISPLRGYLALSKNLLASIHRADPELPPELTRALAAHVARTWDASDRAADVIRREEVVRNRGEFVLKPCQAGGAEGVMVGAAVDAEAWARKIDETWDLDTWALQEFHAPVRTTKGEWTSLGLYSFGGQVGGLLIRTASSLLISARDAGVVIGIPRSWLA